MVLLAGATHKSRLNKLISKQNKCIRNIFFAHSRESSDPYYKLLDILLKLDNIFKLKIAGFTHKILANKVCISVIFSDFVLPAVSIHSHNTRYASDQTLYRIHVRTNYGKFTFKCRAALIWETIPKELKSLNS